MSYDFSLFVPDRTPDGAIDISSRHLAQDQKLTARRTAPMVSTPEIETVASLINHDVAQLADLRPPIEIETVVIDGDRTIGVQATEETAVAARYYLMKLALQHGLGLIDEAEEVVLLYGDEDPRFELVTSAAEVPAVSPTGLGHLCDFILDTETVNRYFIVADVNAEQRYVQTRLYDEEAAEQNYALTHVRAHDYTRDGDPETKWWVEYREGSPDHHYGIAVENGAKVAELVRQWMSGDPAFESLDWQKMHF